MDNDGSLLTAIQTGGAAWAVLVAPWLIVASTITAVLRGWLIPRKSHEEIVNTYREQTEFWRDQAKSVSEVAERSVELNADLATRRELIRSTRIQPGQDRGSDD